MYMYEVIESHMICIHTLETLETRMYTLGAEGGRLVTILSKHGAEGDCLVHIIS